MLSDEQVALLKSFQALHAPVAPWEHYDRVTRRQLLLQIIDAGLGRPTVEELQEAWDAQLPAEGS